MHRISIVAAGSLAGLGFGTAAIDPHAATGIIAGSTAVCTAIVWLGRMVWRASADRQQILDRLEAGQKDAHGALERIENRLDSRDEDFKKMQGSVAAIRATCAERCRQANLLTAVVAKAGGPEKA